jgi:hypothetical protein
MKPPCPIKYLKIKWIRNRILNIDKLRKLRMAQLYLAKRVTKELKKCVYWKLEERIYNVELSFKEGALHRHEEVLEFANNCFMELEDQDVRTPLQGEFWRAALA